MDLELLKAGADHIPVLRRLVQLYLCEIFLFGGWDINDDGTYGDAKRIETFWIDKKRENYLLKVEGKLAGFAMTRSGTYFSGADAKEISEFFILRKYRRRGIGKTVAGRLFDGFAGTWEAAVLNTNIPAQHFGRAAIADYTGGAYQEFSAHYGECDFVVFRLAGAGEKKSDRK